MPNGVIESLRYGISINKFFNVSITNMNFRKVATSENTLTFERFCAGLKICLLRNNADSRSEKEMTVG